MTSDPGDRPYIYRPFLPVAMGDTWLCDVGLRVTNLAASVEFYTNLLDLEELRRGGDAENQYVLFRDRRSGQRLELNWYAETSPFWSPYVAGEGLDHLEVRVHKVAELLPRLAAKGIHPVNRTLWVNPRAVEKLQSDPLAAREMSEETWLTSTGHRIAYVPDPDGNLVCLYDHPEEPWDGPIPDHY